MEAATDGALFIGLREWLAIRVGLSNLSWQRSVATLAFPEAQDPEVECRKNAAHGISTLIDVLDRYIHERSAVDGLSRIFIEYGRRWLELNSRDKRKS
jgi:hypothetical protein